MAIAVYGLTNDSIDSAAAISVSKMVHAHGESFSQTSTIAAATYYFGPARAGGSIISFEAAITEAIATGADRTVTVNLLKSTGGGAFGTVLSASIQFTNGSTLRAVSSATISSAAFIDNDLFQVTVAVAGAAGAQATGLTIRAFWTESYA